MSPEPPGVLVIHGETHQVLVEDAQIEGVLVFHEPLQPVVVEDDPEQIVIVFETDEFAVEVVEVEQSFIVIEDELPPVVIDQATQRDVIVLDSVGLPGQDGAPGPPGPQGPPGSGTSYDLLFGFASPSLMWSLPHNLDTFAVSVSTFDQNGDMIEGNVRYVSSNLVEVDWYYPTAGSARVYR